MRTILDKLAKRYRDGLCIACGHRPCTCKTRGKLRNRTKGIGRNEAREPSLAAIHWLANRPTARHSK